MERRNQSAFEIAEFRARYEKYQSHMAERGIDLLIIDQPETLAYIAGFARTEGYYNACVVPKTGDPMFVVRRVDAISCKQQGWFEDVVDFSDWEDSFEVIFKGIADRGWSTSVIGVDENSYCMTIQRFGKFKAEYGHARFVDISNFVLEAFSIKSEAEINYLRQACNIADVSLQEVAHRLQVGDTSRKCVTYATNKLILMGAEAGVSGPVTKALHEDNMHPLIDDRPYDSGDVIHVETIPRFKGYSARLMRPISVGEPSPELVEAAQQICEIQDAQFAAMKPGACARDVDKIMREGLLESGLRAHYTNVTGYALGYYHGYTCRSSDFSYVFRPNDIWELKAGMTMHMYTVAKGMGFSETVLIGENGAEILTKTPRELLVAHPSATNS